MFKMIVNFVNWLKIQTLVFQLIQKFSRVWNDSVDTSLYGGYVKTNF